MKGLGTLSAWSVGPFGRAAIALVVGTLTGLFACLLVHPSTAMLNHGLEYAELSAHLFDESFESRFRYRILAPLLGSITGYTGPRFVYVPWAFGVLFLAATYHEVRRTSSTAIALLGTFAMASSSTTLLSLFAPAYTDTITYFFILLAFLRVDQKFLSAACFALALWNHESAAFLLPGLLLHRYARKGTGKDLALYALVLFLFMSPYIGYRCWVHVNFTQALSMGWYLSAVNVSNSISEVKLLAPIGLFLAFTLFWFLPLCAWRIVNRKRRWTYAAIFFGVSLQQIIAVDTTRLYALAFPMILLALLDLDRHFGPLKTAVCGYALFALSLFIPHYMVSGNTLISVGTTKGEVVKSTK